MAKQTFTVGQVLTAAQMTSLQQTAMGGGSATAKVASYVLVAADAGTTVAMNAAGATTITVNTGLFAAGDTVFIQNLGAGACTVTAGTATVATAGSLILPQNDAGILYFTATGASIFYDYIQAGAVSPLTTKGDLYTFSTSDARLAVGTNGTTLVADSSEATGLKWAAAGGALTIAEITSGSMPSATELSLTGLTGDYYMLQLKNLANGTGTTDHKIRFNSSSSAIYSRFGFYQYSSTLETLGDDAATGLNLSVGGSLMSGSNGFIMEIKNAKNAGFTTVTLTGYYRNGGNSVNLGIAYEGYFASASAITSIQVLNDNAYTYTGGTYKLIGG